MTDIKENKKEDENIVSSAKNTVDMVKPASAESSVVAKPVIAKPSSAESLPAERKGSGEVKPAVAKNSGEAKKEVLPEKTEKQKEENKGKTENGGSAEKSKNNRPQFRRDNSKTGQGQRQGRDRGGRGGGRGRRGSRFERAKPEFDQKIINIRRVTRVMAGGRRFSFSVAVVAGNRNGKVGVGLGKASDTSLAIEKAFKNAKKNMIMIKRDKNLSIPHEVSARYCTSEIFIKPAKGKGIVAGSSARNVLDFAGITDVSSKVLSRSKNKINIARATILALREFTE